MRLLGLLAVSGLTLAAAHGAMAGERAAASVACSATETSLVYSCMITVEGKKTGQAVEAEALTVKADMPAMPMAHNVPPTQALAVEGKPGMYSATLELEMFGEWALAIDVDGVLAGTDQRVRDKVVVKQIFGKSHSMDMEHGSHQDDAGDQDAGSHSSHQGHGSASE